jgi:hypothetical protein
LARSGWPSPRTGPADSSTNSVGNPNPFSNFREFGFRPNPLRRRKVQRQPMDDALLVAAGIVAAIRLRGQENYSRS